jgi:glutamate--cysteine ligase
MNKITEKFGLENIKEIYTSGCKPVSEHKLGIEYERLALRTDGKTADYYSEFGVCNFLREFAKEDNWDYITDDCNIIGLKQGHDVIMLEPGSQVELSLEPQAKISDVEKKINSLDQKMAPLLEKFGFKLPGYGVSPVSTYKDIDLIPKRRYYIMAKYLWGILSDVMMRETAGIQVCVDFSDEADMVRKFNIANKLSPFMTAMFANSPIRGGVDTGYKSFRALSWLNTDNDRCGFAGGLEEDFSFERYIDCVLKSPLIYIERENLPVEINGKVNFSDFIASGYEGFEPVLKDYLLHANLYFPEVRLRNFIEIRNHDCVSRGLQYSILAIYKGILYNKSALDEIEKLLCVFDYADFARLRYDVPQDALNSRIKNHCAGDIAKEILRIAEKALLENNEGEEKYLEPIKELTLQNLCPADIILRDRHGSGNWNIKKLIEYAG